MVRIRLLAIVACVGICWPTRAEAPPASELPFHSGVPALSTFPDSPLVRKLLTKLIIEELQEHRTEQTAWFNEKRKDRQSWTSGKVFGKPIRLASWTEESKTWLWLEEPEQTLAVELKQLTPRDGRLEFAISVTAKARFKAWGRIPKLGQASVGGNLLADLEMVGSTAIGKGKLQDSQVTTLDGKLRDLRFNNDLAHPLEDLAKDALNDYVRDKNHKLRRSIERAIDRVHF